MASGSSSLATRGCCPSLFYFIKRHYGLLIVFTICVGTVIHIGLILFPTFTWLQTIVLESLTDLVWKAQTLGTDTNPTAVVAVGGQTIYDDNDWLNPSHLGFREIRRASSSRVSSSDLDGPASSSFNPSLWTDKFFYRTKLGINTTTRALPTNAWWQPWVMPPGTGSKHSINQHPYTLKIISKDFSTRPIPGADRAGMEILAPYVEIINSNDGNAFGVEQSQGNRQIGWFMGVELPDVNDYVERHFIESFGPLEVTKRWDLSTSTVDIDGTTFIEKPKIKSFLRSHVVRGSSFISMEIPSGVRFILEALPTDNSKRTKNFISHITSFSVKPSERLFTCSQINDPLLSDSVEITLSDHSQWVLILDQKVNLTCLSTASGDRVASFTPLVVPLLARLAVVDITDHNDVRNDKIVGAKSTMPRGKAKRFSQIRWQLLADIKQTQSRSITEYVKMLNKEKKVTDALRSRFTKFPLRDQIQHLARKYKFGVAISRWNENEILQAIEIADPDIIVFPDNFIDNPDEFHVSDNFRLALMSTHIGDKGRTVLGVGGIKSRKITTFFDKVLDVKLEPVSVWDPAVDNPIRILREIERTHPTSQTEFIVNNDLLPANMPQTMPKPKRGNSVELIRKSYPGFPFMSYCRPSGMGSASTDKDTCDGAAHIYYYIGRGSIQWIGMNWSDAVEDLDSEWAKLLERTIFSATCTEGKKLPSGRCRTIRSVLLIGDVNAARQEELLSDLMTAILVKTKVTLADEKIEDKDEVDFQKTVNFLKGNKEIITGNIGEETTFIKNPETETLRDFVLRHALMIPVASSIDIESTQANYFLRYKMEIRGIKNLTDHSLYPVYDIPKRNLMWDPYQLMVYLTPLHRKLESSHPLAHLVSLERNSLEDDQTTCLPSVVGLLCGRSFGPSPSCVMSEFIPSPDSRSQNKRKCTVSVQGTLDKDSWDITKIHGDLNKGKSAIVSHYKFGKPVGITINVPTTNWDLFVKQPTGQYISLSSAMHPKWIENIRWAISEDTSGTWKLDGNEWAKDDAADDLNKWARRIYRYAQIALIADSVGQWNERRTALGWLETALTKFYNNRFDNKGLIYDADWGGLVSCGCDRDNGKTYCVPPPRMGYLDRLNIQPTLLTWIERSCPALVNPSKEDGAGFYENHHVLWGYIVFSTAVANRLDPTFANQRVRLHTPTGVRKPKIHHIVMALIQDYANPMLLEPFDSSDVLERYFPGARYKDWWRLHSYGTSISSSPGDGPSQYSLSEAAFGYWAASLYASTVGDHDLSRWAKLLTATEIVAGNAFWHLKEFTESVPVPLRYLGAAGKVSESSITFQTKFSVSPFEVFSNQILPLNLLSFEVLEPGWVLWMKKIFQDSCDSNRLLCSAAGSDLTLSILQFFSTDWKRKTEHEPLTKEAQTSKMTEEIDKTVASLISISCFQMGSYDCGLHTLSTAMYMTAMAYTWGGVPNALSREDGNGRFQIY